MNICTAAVVSQHTKNISKYIVLWHYSTSEMLHTYILESLNNKHINFNEFNSSISGYISYVIKACFLVNKVQKVHVHK